MTNQSAWLPELIYTNGSFAKDCAIVCDESGNIERISQTGVPATAVRLKDRALFPGLINAHSHAFQRVIRGRTEHRAKNVTESFWTWRQMMYRAANRLTPEDIYDASRMAFLEMALSGITTVGEFHYLHNQYGGTPYDDRNLLAKEAIRAARDVGLRIVLLRVAYARSGFRLDPNPDQSRFVEADPEIYLQGLAELRSDVHKLHPNAWVGLAPHSIRALPLNYLKQICAFGNEEGLVVHMHVAEQPAEIRACLEENGQTPVALLAGNNLLNERFTAVHAIHLATEEVASMARANAHVCACPTTERNLGDGIFPAESFFAAGVKVSLGTDSQVQIDLFEDARELEYHMRLQKLERAVLAFDCGEQESLAQRLFDSATLSGASSLAANAGELVAERWADFFTVSLDDPSIAGASETDLLTTVVFSLGRSAICDVVVGGKTIVENHRHKDQEEIVEKFKALQRRLWS